MSVARGNGQNGGHFYSNITQPIKVELSFIVDSTNVNGLGVSSVKSNGYVNKVFMNTSATPAAGNPNPQANYVIIQMNNNYNKFLTTSLGFASPLSGTPLTSTTAGLAYIITSLGNTTLAQWRAAGFPYGAIPAVGASFIAITTGAIGGTGVVQEPLISGSDVTNIEIIGNPTLVDTTSIAQYGGMWIIGGFLANGVPTAVADGSTCTIGFLFDASSVTIDGL